MSDRELILALGRLKVETGSWRASWAAPSSPGRCGIRRKCLVEDDSL